VDKSSHIAAGPGRPGVCTSGSRPFWSLSCPGGLAIVPARVSRVRLTPHLLYGIVETIAACLMGTHLIRRVSDFFTLSTTGPEKCTHRDNISVYLNSSVWRIIFIMLTTLKTMLHPNNLRRCILRIELKTAQDCRNGRDSGAGRAAGSGAWGKITEAGGAVFVGLPFESNEQNLVPQFTMPQRLTLWRPGICEKWQKLTLWPFLILKTYTCQGVS
jgi:hypothetical protein